MLYNLMGWTAFSGYLVLLFALPLNALIVKRAAVLHRIEFTMRDRRIQAVNEALQAIKLIKFSGWESRWINRILNVRQTELKWLRKLKIIYIFTRMMWGLVPVLVLATSFICFTLFAEREMTVDVAFPCITVFGILSPSLTSVRTIIYGLHCCSNTLFASDLVTHDHKLVCFYFPSHLFYEYLLKHLFNLGQYSVSSLSNESTTISLNLMFRIMFLA